MASRKRVRRGSADWAARVGAALVSMTASDASTSPEAESPESVRRASTTEFRDPWRSPDQVWRNTNELSSEGFPWRPLLGAINIGPRVR